jgi:flagellar biogenesis protein FliO
LGVFANVLMNAHERNREGRPALRWRGVTAWLFERIHRRAGGRSRLAVVEKICLAPRQTLTLVEVDGERVLVGLSREGSPQFYRLNAITSSRTQKRFTEIPVEGTVA